MIREVIIVEGKDDIAAVKRAVDAELIATSGFGITPETLAHIAAVRTRRGIIILTDPDHAGEQIRARLTRILGACKHAFIPKSQAQKNGHAGIEYASPQAIREALERARCGHEEPRYEFSTADLIAHGLTGNPNAAAQRRRLGAALGIGFCNAKQLLNRLNHYGVERSEFEAALR